MTPFWSPDGRNIAFFADGKLKRVPRDGGEPLVVCDGVGSPRGGAWGRDDVILFGRANWPICRVSARGGVPVAVTQLDTTQQQSHRYPFLLPDGRHFVFLAESRRPEDRGREAICWAALDGGKPRHVLDATSTAIYAERGQLVFRRQGQLMAQSFDPRSGRVSGSPRILAPATDVSPLQKVGAPTFTVSAGGLLVCEVAPMGRDRLNWYDRSGRPTGAANGLLPPCFSVAPSPDARRALYVLADPNGGGCRLWMVDLENGLGTSLTQGVDGWNGALWSPDGRRIYFNRATAGHEEIWTLDLDGPGPERRVFRSATSPTATVCDCVPPKGEHLLVGCFNEANKQAVWLVPVSGTESARPLVGGAFETSSIAAVSPDGHGLAYASDETGRLELYVTKFPELAARQ